MMFFEGKVSLGNLGDLEFKVCLLSLPGCWIPGLCHHAHLHCIKFESCTFKGVRLKAAIGQYYKLGIEVALHVILWQLL